MESGFHSPALWFDANDLNADGTTDSTATGTITSWNDKSGNDRHAGSVVGTPDLNTTNGPNGGRVVQFRSGSSDGTTGDEEFSISELSPLRIISMWSEVPRPTGVITEESLEEETAGRVILFSKEIRNIFTAINTSKVWYNGNSIISGNYALPGITNYFILRVVVNDNNIGNRTGWKLGDDGAGWSMDMDLAEAICFSSELTDAEADAVEGYLNDKWGLNILDNDHPASVYFDLSDTNDNVGSGNWHMLSVTADRGKLNFYVDGTLDGTGNRWFFPGLNTVTGLSLGKGPNGSDPMPPLMKPLFPPFLARQTGYLPALIIKSPVPLILTLEA